MVHGDNKGLVLPPRVAPLQVIILPIAMKNVEYSDLLGYCEDLKAVLKRAGVRADVDSRQNYTPGWKFNHWELKGVPVRIEVGPRDIANKQCRLVRRDNGMTGLFNTHILYICVYILYSIYSIYTCVTIAY